MNVNLGNDWNNTEFNRGKIITGGHVDEGRTSGFINRSYKKKTEGSIRSKDFTMTDGTIINNVCSKKS